ncbi:MAG: hypothetical protein JW929_04055 [Anaerolineales bacterium]|nr:hypothetical protein [Anaerolineales bacterium]
MNENRNPIESQPESGEVRSAEQQALDDATFESDTHIEQTGDFQQAEAIQNTSTALAKPSVAVEQAEAAPIPLTRPEDDGGMGGPTEVRGDPTPSSGQALDQATAGGDAPGGDDATPIDLPDLRRVAAAEEQRSEQIRPAEQPQDRLEYDKPEAQIDAEERAQSPGGRFERPGNTAANGINDILSGGGHSGLQGDPFETGGPLKKGSGGTKGGLFDEGGPQGLENPGDTVEKIQGLMGNPMESKDPGKMGGGPGSIHPKFDHAQAGGEPYYSGYHSYNFTFDEGAKKFSGDQKAREAGRRNSEAELDLVGPIHISGKATDKKGKDPCNSKEQADQLLCAGSKPKQVDDPEQPPDPKKPKGSAQKQMGHPDEGQGGGQTKPGKAEDINQAKAGGILVKDPAYGQGGQGDGQVLFTKHPGQVTDYGYEGGKAPLSGGVRTYRDQVIDPAEPTVGLNRHADKSANLSEEEGTSGGTIDQKPADGKDA